MTHDRLELLITTDDPNAPWYPVAHLPRDDYAVRLARHSLSALNSYVMYQPDVILIDFATYAIDAEALARTFRQSAEASNSLVLLIGIDRPGAARKLDDPTESGVDLLLSREEPGLGGELLRVLNCFREFLGHLKDSEAPFPDEFELAESGHPARRDFPDAKLRVFPTALSYFPRPQPAGRVGE